MRMIKSIFYVLIIYTFFKINTSNGLHVRGTFNTNEFFKFVTRFGVQSTDEHNEINTRGYIYGNITLFDSTDPAYNKSNPASYQFPHNSFVMLTVMDYNYFIDYYNKRHLWPKSSACSLMFEQIKKTAYFFECAEQNKQDFIRRIPCEQNKLCIDEDREINVIKNNQFTFLIRDYNQARFWYISLVACTRDTKTCEWTDLSYREKTVTHENNTTNSTTFTRMLKHQYPSFTVAYDIWLVQGNPLSETRSNHFEHQFSYELHDIFEIYLFSFLVYLFILPFILFRLYLHFHYLYLQLFVYVSVEFTSRCLALLHNLVFSFNGRGVYAFQFAGDFLEAFASSILMLILLSIAKGWTIRSSRLKMSKNFYSFGFLLQSSLIISHMISLETVDPVFNSNSYQTVSGYVELSVRFACMIWFVLELKETFANLESAAFKNTQKSTVMENNNENKRDDDNDIYELDEDDYEITRDGKKYFSLNEQQERNKEILLSNNTNKQHTSSNTFDSLTVDERLKKYQKFYLHYGACCLVWFIYLPILIFITSFVSELYRLRLVLSIRYFVNFISVIVLFYIMWSTKTPLKLPGKKYNKYEQINLQFHFSYHEEETDLPANNVKINAATINNDSTNSNSLKMVDFDSEEDTVFVASDSVNESAESLIAKSDHKA